ncbi:hypothetical protein LDENG_00200860, partial [Lucifuga dentata]
HPGGERIVSDRPVNGLYSVPSTNSDGELDALEELAMRSQDMPLRMKLEQLRKWQQHMQEQLKAHQLEELLRLQEEQQRLLEIMNGSQHCSGERAGLSSGAAWEEKTLQRNGHTESSHTSTQKSHGAPQRSTCSPRQEKEVSQAERLQRGQSHEDVDEGVLNSRDDDIDFQEHDITLIPDDGVDVTEELCTDKEAMHDRPIKPGIGGQKQTFEELLEEQLRLEEQRLKAVQQQSQNGAKTMQAPPKRAFLKRGEGLSRFTNNHKHSLPKHNLKKDLNPQTQARIISQNNPDLKSIQKGSRNGAKRLPVQRKTAILNNKENRPPQDFSKSAEGSGKPSKMQHRKSHQRQNTEGAESNIKHQPGQEKEQNNKKVTPSSHAVRKPEHNTQPNPVSKQASMPGGQDKAENHTIREKSCVSRLDLAEGRSRSEEDGGGYSFISSFQEKMQQWE